MYVVGKFIFIYNDTDRKITDLLFLHPKIEVVSKVKKCLPHQHVQELIMDIAYYGPVTFFFADEGKKTFTFTFDDTKAKQGSVEASKDTYHMYLKVIEKDGKRMLEKDRLRDSYQD